MRNKARQPLLFNLASVPMASWVALWLVFILATHAFWCGLGGSQCADVTKTEVFSLLMQTVGAPVLGTPAPSATAQHTVHHTHSFFDVCSGTDETRNSTASVASILVPPLAIWIAVLFAAFAVVLVSLLQQAAIFGRDGPVCVPPLHSRLVRTSLPHRAPPVLLT